MAVLEPGGELLLEHGANQADGVGDILREQGWTECRVFNDLSGQPRVSTARKPVRTEAR
jgi:methylase of polypeptide subunit release factors